MNQQKCLLSKYRTELMGIAAIGVILCHAVSNDVMFPSMVAKLLGVGNLGVDIFLLVSGFGMYFSLSKAFDTHSLSAWYKKRACRIFVPYIVLMAPYWVGYCIYKGTGIVSFFYYFSTLSFWCEHVGTWYVAALIPTYLLLPVAFCFWRKHPASLTVAYIAITMLLSLITIGNINPLADSVIYNIQYVLQRIPALWIGLYWGYYSSSLKYRGGGVRTYAAVSILAVVIYCALIIWSHKIINPKCLWILAISFSAGFCFLLEISKDVQLLKRLTGALKAIGERSLESYLSNYVCVYLFKIFDYEIFGIDVGYGNYLYYSLVIIVGLLITFGSAKVNRRILSAGRIGGK